jgi:hypothetical protein
MCPSADMASLITLSSQRTRLDFDPDQQYRLTAVQHDLATPLGKLELEEPNKVTDATL